MRRPWVPAWRLSELLRRARGTGASVQRAASPARDSKHRVRRHPDEGQGTRTVEDRHPRPNSPRDRELGPAHAERETNGDRAHGHYRARARVARTSGRTRGGASVQRNHGSGEPRPSASSAGVVPDDSRASPDTLLPTLSADIPACLDSDQPVQELDRDTRDSPVPDHCGCVGKRFSELLLRVAARSIKEKVISSCERALPAECRWRVEAIAQGRASDSNPLVRLRCNRGRGAKR
jgi:hypothetical protein